MWANAVWWFGQSALALFLAWLGMTQSGPLADLFLVGAAILGVASVIVLIWPILRRRIKVVSHILILIGLVGGAISVGLVATGFAMQTFWPIQVTATTAQTSQSALPTQSLSSTAIQERLAAIKIANGILSQAQQFTTTYGRVPQELIGLITKGNAEITLEYYVKDFNPILNGIQQFARDYRQSLPEIDKAFLGDYDTAYVIGIHKAGLDLRDTILESKERQDGIKIIQQSANYEAWERSTTALPRWIGSARQRLQTLYTKYANQ